jgi:alpha-1,6-mannosyltransferase
MGATARDFVQDLARDYIRRLYSRFAATFVPSPHLADLLRGWGVANAVAVRLGVDATVFCPGPRDPTVRRELGIPADRLLLLTVGRLAGEKNVAGVLAAFRVLHAREPGRYHLMLVGDGPLRSLVDRAAAETGAVTWRSYYDDSARLAAVYRAADLMVHPGVNETFGLVTVEAQACGLPVAAYRGTFMDRLAFCGVEQWAAERTSEALAAVVQRMVSGDRAALGARVAAAAAEYAWPRVFDELFARYRALL